MVGPQSTVSASTEPANIDLLRRYCPHPSIHTHEQIAAYLLPDDHGCWLWPGTVNPEGYGYVSCKPTAYGLPQSVQIHRYMYDILMHEIPYGYHVHHKCRVRHCWNPFHLQQVTPQEHIDIHRNGHSNGLKYH